MNIERADPAEPAASREAFGMDADGASALGWGCTRSRRNTGWCCRSRTARSRRIPLVTGEGAMPFGAEFGFAAAAPGFTVRVRHRAAGRERFDAE
ncbi:hypothetical protein ACWGJB_04255 [Streptomyces sp. NPDC054813]